MARAFIASIPLTLLLVAAVVVSVAVTPGSFGFEAGPHSQRADAAGRPIDVPVAILPAAHAAARRAVPRPVTPIAPRVHHAAPRRPELRTVAIVPHPAPGAGSHPPAPAPPAGAPHIVATPAPQQQPAPPPPTPVAAPTEAPAPVQVAAAPPQRPVRAEPPLDRNLGRLLCPDEGSR